jgi:hypothetical protein
MKKLLLGLVAAGALAAPGAALGDRADSTVTITCTQGATVIFSATMDANAEQGQLQVIEAQAILEARLGATCEVSPS